MTTFDDRETAFENRFVHDQELGFRAEARCNRLLGLWAAELLGKTGESAEAYARDVVKADFQEVGPEDVLRKLVADLTGKADPDAIRARRAELLTQARGQIMFED